jgi:hypothetical protein
LKFLKTRTFNGEPTTALAVGSSLDRRLQDRLDPIRGVN